MAQSTNEKITDNPSLLKMKRDLEGMVAFSKIVSVLENLGIRHDEISEAMRQVPNLAQQLQEMSTVPDRFNEHFSGFGWVAYEGLNFDLMKQAIELADNGKIPEAEETLTEHYDQKIIHLMLTRMRFIPEFKPRERMLRKALDDYVAGRYHACVPVVLASVDGLVNDIEQKGFFAQEINLTAWDSIAAHSSGLQQLARLFGTKRVKTRSKTITIPYRHGIMHGHDLGYDNKTVAAKTWAALFALRDWVIAIRKPKQEPEKPPSFLELLQHLRARQKERERLQNWKPRKLRIGTDIPATGQPEDYGEKSPERTFVEFMSFWSKKNYGKMGQLISSFDQRETLKKTAGWVREIFDQVTLCSFTILDIEDRAPAITIIEAEISCRISPHNERTTILKIRLDWEGNAGKKVLRDDSAGHWRVEMASFSSTITTWRIITLADSQDE
jgi:hypothetical protein